MSLQRHIESRLGGFVRRGLLEGLPSPFQVRQGTRIMRPLYLSESPRERVASRRTLLGQVPVRVWIQLAYCPAMLRSTTGFELTAEQLVRHLLCVYHEDSFLGYDLQMLRSHDGGLELLAARAEAVAVGDGRRARILRSVVGGSGYHAGLVRLAEAARSDAYPDPEDLDPRFVTLLGFARFCRGLPEWPSWSFYGFERPSAMDGT